MKRRKHITQPVMQPPYYRAERLAAELNVSLSTFRRFVRDYNFTKRRAGKGRGFVWYDWRDVRRKLHKAGFTNLPKLSVTSKGRS